MAMRGKSRAATVVELFFDGVLLICFIAQAFILGCLFAYGHLPLPTKWFSNTINGKLPPGFFVSAESYALTLDGTIRIENIELKLDGIQQSVFNADYAHLEFGSEWNGGM